ncbi:hypothetical protein [Nitrososphaera sp. AFS]|nr:hypothetical protein [Nitrososphaera sp. AFS]
MGYKYEWKFHHPNMQTLTDINYILISEISGVGLDCTLEAFALDDMQLS